MVQTTRRRPAAVTFDCWGTLLVEKHPGETHARRVQAVVDTAARAGRVLAASEARRALDAGWSRHFQLWEGGVASGAAEIAGWSLAAIGLTEGHLQGALASRLAEATLESDVRALEGARDSLARLDAEGVRLALVCDTGFSPGRVVRKLLAREGLGELLSVQVYSDEAGVPKPHRRVFELALRELGHEPEQALHVGDLRRTDVAGGRGAGLGTVRIRAHYDDPAPLPEADAVADSHGQLRELLDLE